MNIKRNINIAPFHFRPNKPNSVKVQGPSAELISRLHDLGNKSVHPGPTAPPDQASSPSESIVSSAEQDEWSRQVDALDKLGPLTQHSQADSFSEFNHHQGAIVTSPTSSGRSVSNSNRNSSSNNNNNNDRLGGFDDLHVSELQKGAEIQLKEVETELSAILTPTPVELHRLVLNKTTDTDFGLSLSDGVYEKGVYISAIRPNGPAQTAGVKIFDKVLQVRFIFSCPLINLFGKCTPVFCQDILLSVVFSAT